MGVEVEDSPGGRFRGFVRVTGERLVEVAGPLLRWEPDEERPELGEERIIRWSGRCPPPPARWLRLRQQFPRRVLLHCGASRQRFHCTRKEAVLQRKSKKILTPMSTTMRPDKSNARGSAMMMNFLSAYLNLCFLEVKLFGDHWQPGFGR